MNDNSALRVKRNLEELYDLPFDVERSQHYEDAWFTIKPQNSARELFDVELKLKNQLRLIIEVTPEKYAASSIQDMSSAPEESRLLFSEYARQLNARKAKTDFSINGIPCDATDPASWPKQWSNYRMRTSRSPICNENEEFNEVEIVTLWATLVIGMFLSLLDVTKIDNDEHLEGGVNRIEINKYERNPVNRELCLAANGYTCKICGFDFERYYGDIGKHFIHVHHIVPISKMTEAYAIDPVNDLIPVCPNCHAMLHRSDPPLHPEELKHRIQEIQSDKKTGTEEETKK